MKLKMKINKLYRNATYGKRIPVRVWVYWQWHRLKEAARMISRTWHNPDADIDPGPPLPAPTDNLKAVKSKTYADRIRKGRQ